MFMSVLSESSLWDYSLWSFPTPLPKQTLIFSTQKLLHQSILLHSQLTAAFPHGTCLHPANTGYHSIFEACSATLESRGWRLVENLRLPSTSSFFSLLEWVKKAEVWRWDSSGGHLPNRQFGWLAGIQWCRMLIQRASSWSQSICHLLWLPNR